MLCYDVWNNFDYQLKIISDKAVENNILGKPEQVLL